MDLAQAENFMIKFHGEEYDRNHFEAFINMSGKIAKDNDGHYQHDNF